MQRKNHTLKSHSGFAMIMAISILVLVATILALSLALTATTSKRNIETYFLEHAEIIADSAREYAMYRIGGVPCSIAHDGFADFTQDSFYTISISVRYVTRNGCNNDGVVGANDYAIDPSLTKPSAALDIAMRVNPADSGAVEEIRFFKRYIELIQE